MRTKLFLLALLGSVLLLGSCTKNETETAVENMISATAPQQAAALKEVQTLLSADRSAFTTSLDALIYKLDPDLAVEDLFTFAQKEVAADPDFVNEFSSLLLKYRNAVSGSNETEMRLLRAEITALLKGEAARATARKKDCQDAQTAAAGLLTKVQTQIAELEALSPVGASFDAYKTLTGNTNGILASAASVLRPFYKDASSYSTALSAISGKLGDDLLKNAFEEYVKAGATRQDLSDKKAFQSTRLAEYERVLAEYKSDIDGYQADIETYKTELAAAQRAAQQLEGRVKTLEDQMKKLNDETVKDLDIKVTNLITTVNGIAATLSVFPDGDLKGYIDQEAQSAYDAAVQYVDGTIKQLCEELIPLLWDLGWRVEMALNKIQSVVYVPDYEDLRMTVNSVVLVQGGESIVIDQPGTVTYQILPAQYAQIVAESVKAAITEDFWLGTSAAPDILKETGDQRLTAWFEVLPVETRVAADPLEVVPYIQILDVLGYDERLGTVTFEILPQNIASANFAAGGLKPRYDLELYDQNGYYIQGGTIAEYYSDEQYFNGKRPDGWSVPVWDFNDIEAYQNRTAFAVQLRLYQLLGQEFDADEESTYRRDFENELASAFTTLYPNLYDYAEIYSGVCAPELDENNNFKYDDDGFTLLKGVEDMELVELPASPRPSSVRLFEGFTPAYVYHGQLIAADEFPRIFPVLPSFEYFHDEAYSDDAPWLKERLLVSWDEDTNTCDVTIPSYVSDEQIPNLIGQYVECTYKVRSFLNVDWTIWRRVEVTPPAL